METEELKDAPRPLSLSEKRDLRNQHANMFAAGLLAWLYLIFALLLVLISFFLATAAIRRPAESLDLVLRLIFLLSPVLTIVHAVFAARRIRSLERKERALLEQLNVAHEVERRKNYAHIEFCAGIQFAREDPQDTLLEQDVQTTSHRIVTAVSLAVLVLSLGAIRWLGLMPRLGGWILLIIPLIAAVYGVRSACIWYRRRRFVSQLPLHPDESQRLQCIGNPGAITSVGPLRNILFEPAEFNIAWTKSAYGRDGAKALALLTGVIALVVYVGAVFAYSLPLLPAILFCAPFIVSTVYAVVATFWRTRLRIVPGRMEVLQYSVFGRRRSYRVVIPLRETKVLVNMWKHYVRVEGPGVENGKWILGTQLVPRRRELAYYVLLAALSTHKPGPIDDEAGEAAG